jgi:hypothetical protein
MCSGNMHATRFVLRSSKGQGKVSDGQSGSANVFTARMGSPLT